MQPITNGWFNPGKPSRVSDAGAQQPGAEAEMAGSDIELIIDMFFKGNFLMPSSSIQTAVYPKP